VLADHVQPALGGEFLAPLGHQAAGVRPSGKRDPQHLVGGGHLEIERLVDLGLQPRHVLVADVPTILAQMGRDAIGARPDRQLRPAHRVRIAAAPGVAQGGDMIDIDAEAQLLGLGHGGAR